MQVAKTLVNKGNQVIQVEAIKMTRNIIQSEAIITRVVVQKCGLHHMRREYC